MPDTTENTVKLMSVKQTSVSFARPYIAKYHYSHSMPDSTKEVFVGWFKDCIAGVCVFGMGVGPNQYSAIISDIKKGQYRELTRLWSPDGLPKNTESKLIGKSLKQLSPEVILVLSFADPSQGHLGIIYQATNWIYTGMTAGGRYIVDKNGVRRHVKSINICRLRHPELRNKTSQQIMDLHGWEYRNGSSKHRYIYLRLKPKIRHEYIGKYNIKSLPYPKFN